MAIDDRQSERSDLLVSEKKGITGAFGDNKEETTCVKRYFIFCTEQAPSFPTIPSRVDRLAVPCAVSTDLSTRYL